MIDSFIVTPDSKYIIAAYFDTTIDTWDITTFKKLSSLKASKNVSSLAVTPDNKYVLVGTENTIYLMPTPALESLLQKIASK